MEKDNLLLLKAELENELQENILAWWMKYSPDPGGGFHGHIDHENKVVERAGKGAVLNARILWTFSAAYRMYKRPEYLNMASGDDYPLKKAKGLFRDLEAHALDRENKGYTDAFSRDWKALEDLRLSEKDQNESLTMNTHLHILEAYGNLYRIWKDPDLKKALENLIQLFLEKFVDRERKQLNLFFDDHWTLKSTLISYGHNIECSWLLHEAAEILGDPEMISDCTQVAIEMASANETGLAADGGLHYEFFPETGDLDSDKHWWSQAEALVGYFNAYQLSGEENFLKRSLGSWAYIKEQIIDHKLGEWY